MLKEITHDYKIILDRCKIYGFSGKQPDSVLLDKEMQLKSQSLHRDLDKQLSGVEGKV